GADVPEDHLARVEAHAHRELAARRVAEGRREVGEAARDVQRRVAGLRRVALECDRSAEEDLDALAGQAIDGPAEEPDRAGHGGEEALDQLVPLLGVEAGAEADRAEGVDEEDRDRLALAARGLQRDRVLRLAAGMAERGLGEELDVTAMAAGKDLH